MTKTRVVRPLEEVGKAEDPPVDAVRVGQRFGVWERRLAQPHNDPGTWYLLVLTAVKNTAQSAAARIQKGDVVGVETGDFEVAFGLHPSMPDRYGVWARYISPEVEPDANS